MPKSLAVAFVCGLLGIGAQAQPCAPFADSFETGDTSVWDTEEGAPSVTSGSTPDGVFRMSTPPPGGKVVSTGPFEEVEYSARFWFDPATLAVTGIGELFSLELSGAVIDIPVAALRWNASDQVQLWTLYDSGEAMTPPLPGPAGPVWVRFGWRAASAPGENDGWIAYQFEGSPAVWMSGLDNDSIVVDQALLGVPSVTSGVAHFDAYEGRCDLSLLLAVFGSGFESGGFEGWEVSTP